MLRTGQVIAVHGDRAEVATNRQGICADCADKTSCSAGAANNPGVAEVVSVHNPLHARPGDTVEFDLPGHSELRVSLLVWVVPLIGIIVGALSGTKLPPLPFLDRDLTTLLGAALGAAVAFTLLIRVDKRARSDESLVPVILRVVPAASCPSSPPVRPASSSTAP
jgi:sigma-E factor negative regulatory protein RseC